MIKGLNEEWYICQVIIEFNTFYVPLLRRLNIHEPEKYVLEATCFQGMQELASWLRVFMRVCDNYRKKEKKGFNLYYAKQVRDMWELRPNVL